MIDIDALKHHLHVIKWCTKCVFICQMIPNYYLVCV